MPMLDVSDVLTDPDFGDVLEVKRTVQTVTEKGRSDVSEQTISIIGVVTSDRGDILDRLPDMRRVAGTIIVHTQFKLIASDGDIDADTITWAGKDYTVTDVNDYSRYGAGFVCAKCEPLRVA